MLEALLAAQPVLETVLEHMGGNLDNRRQLLEGPVPVLLNGCLDELHKDVVAAHAIRVVLSGLQLGCVGLEDESDVVAVDLSVGY